MKKILLTILATAISASLFFPTLAYAVKLEEATFNVNDILSLDGDEQDNTYFEQDEEIPIVALVLNIIDFAVKIIGSIAVIFMIISGIMFIIAQGNQQTLDKAKDVAKYAAIGLIVTFLSYVLIISIQSVFNSA